MKRNKIIIVDNDLGALVMLERLLKVQYDKHFHLDVYMYTNVLDALDSVRGMDLMITDYFMNEIDGIHLSREIYMRGYSLPIIIFSAFANYDNDLRLDVLKKTANPNICDVIHKNDIQKLCDTVGKYILPRNSNTK